MTTLGFNKNDYRIISTDVIEDDSDPEEIKDISYSETLEREDFVFELLEFLRDRTENMSVPIFDKCTAYDISLFLARYDSAFYREDMDINCSDS